MHLAALNHFKQHASLMLITQRQQIPLNEYLCFIDSCARSGVSCVQLREKHATPEFLFTFGQALKETLDPLGIPLIVNDNIELAQKLNAAGVHLGQTDTNPEKARALLGPHKIIGLSIESEDQLFRANTLPLDYVAASAVFETHNKSNLQKIWGLEGVKYLAQHSQHPLIGIGGINLHNINSVLNAGACGIAVIGALHEDANPAQMAYHLRKCIDPTFTLS